MVMDLVDAINAYIEDPVIGPDDNEKFKRKNQCTVICDICKDAKEGRPNNIPPETLKEIILSMYFPGVNPAGNLFVNVIEAATQNISAYAAGLDHLATIGPKGNGDTEPWINLSKSNHTNLHKCTPNPAALFHEGGGKNPKELKSSAFGDAIFETPAGPLDPGTNARSEKVIPGVYDFTKTDNEGGNFYFNLENYGLPANITWSAQSVGGVFSYKLNLIGVLFEFDLSHPNFQEIDAIVSLVHPANPIKLLELLQGNEQKNLFITENCNPLGDDNKSLLCILMVIFKEMGDLMQVLVFIYALVLDNIPIRNVIFSTSDHVVFTQIRDLLSHQDVFDIIKANKYDVEIVHTGGRANVKPGHMNLEIYRNVILTRAEKEKREKISLAKQIHQENFRQGIILNDAKSNLQNIFWLNPNARPHRNPRPDKLTRGGFDATQTGALYSLFDYYIQKLQSINTELDDIIENINAYTLDNIKSLNSPILITKTKNVGAAGERVSYFFISPNTNFSNEFDNAVYPLFPAKIPAHKPVNNSMAGGTRKRKQYGGKYSEYSEHSEFEFESEKNIPKIYLILCSCLASIAYNDDEPIYDESLGENIFYGKYGPTLIETMTLRAYLEDKGLFDEWERNFGKYVFIHDAGMLDMYFSLETLEGNNIFTMSIYEYINQDVLEIMSRKPTLEKVPLFNASTYDESNYVITLLLMSSKIASDYNNEYFRILKLNQEKKKISIRLSDRRTKNLLGRIGTGTDMKSKGYLKNPSLKKLLSMRAGGSRKLKRKMKHYNKKSSSKTKKKLRKLKKTKKLH